MRIIGAAGLAWGSPRVCSATCLQLSAADQRSCVLWPAPGTFSRQGFSYQDEERVPDGGVDAR